MEPLRSAKMVRYKNNGNRAIKIKFSSLDKSAFYKDLERVKSLSGRKFHNEGEKYWTCPLAIESVEKLKEWDFVLDQQLLDFLDGAKINVKEVDEIKIPNLNGKKLYPFQNKGVAFLEKKSGKGLIADEMGLGKTVQALAWLQLHPEKRPAIIAVPASLKLNWKKEAEKWVTNPHVQILQGKKPYPIKGSIVIINYDILPDWVNVLKDINPQVFIMDEIHYTKNNQAKRTKAAKQLAKHCPHVIGLSGTPVVNRPVEAFNALKMIDPTVIPRFWDYVHRYCGPKHNGFGWDFNGATNTDELHEKLINTIMIRRKKADVLKDLPDKVHSFMPIEMESENEYNQAEADFIDFIKRTKGNKAAEKASNAQQLAEIEGLKQLAVQGKMKASIDWIRDFLDVDGKLVVFCTHKFAVERLMKEFGTQTVKVDGSVTGEQRQKAVDRFQNDPNVRLFVGNIKAAGVGLTLTAASTVAFLELPWTPGDLTQAEDRCHRIGQKDSVNIYYLLATGTIEERIARMLDEKRKILDSVLDGKETAEESLLETLIKEYES